MIFKFFSIFTSLNEVHSPALYTLCSRLFAFTPLLENEFPSKLAPNVPNNILRNPPFYFFDSFSIVSVRLLINKPDPLRDLKVVFLTSSISSFEIINIVGCCAKSEGLPKPIFFYESLRLLLMRLLLLPMVSICF